jgi:gluconolactonase
MSRLPLLLLSLTAVAIAQDYPLGPDHERHPNVPQGKVTKSSWTSKIYPGSTRDYWVYVPAQYKADKPACIMIFQDGGGMIDEKGRWRIPLVFDNLISKGEMPVTIGIFINPGIMPALTTASQQNRYNRSYEYDALGDRYARFLIEEILPEVGKQYNLSKDPNDVAIAGSSSGGIAAFVAAWSRPDAFRRVLSFIGSFTNLRGANELPDLIRKTEPKPLRIFLQDGKNDNNIYAGSWYMANQDMASSFEWAGYDYKFVVGTEAHNSKHGSSILPDALRWLWREYPKPITKPTKLGDRQYVTEMSDPTKDWELVSQGHRFTEGPAVDKDGNVFFSDIPNNRIHKISVADGKVSVFKEDTGGVNGLMFGPDGRLYACQNGRKKIVAYTMDGAETTIAEGVNSNDLAITKDGGIYFTEPPTKKVWYIDPKGSKKPVVEQGIEFPNGVRLSPDQSLLFVADYRNRWIWSYQIQPDGSVANGQAFYHLEAMDDPMLTGPDGMTVDTTGHLYVATRLGVQICDQPGRVVGILNKPQEGALSNAVFGGPNRDILYVTAGDKVFRRPMRRKGAVSWEIVKPEQPRL